METNRNVDKTPTCLMSIDQTMNNVANVSVEPNDQHFDSMDERKSKRLGRGAVTTGLTCECGIFAAMATEWSAHKVKSTIHHLQSELLELNAS